MFSADDDDWYWTALTNYISNTLLSFTEFSRIFSQRFAWGFVDTGVSRFAFFLFVFGYLHLAVREIYLRVLSWLHRMKIDKHSWHLENAHSVCYLWFAKTKNRVLVWIFIRKPNIWKKVSNAFFFQAFVPHNFILPNIFDATATTITHPLFACFKWRLPIEAEVIGQRWEPKQARVPLIRFQKINKNSFLHEIALRCIALLMMLSNTSWISL